MIQGDWPNNEYAWELLSIHKNIFQEHFVHLVQVKAYFVTNLKCLLNLLFIYHLHMLWLPKWNTLLPNKSVLKVRISNA